MFRSLNASFPAQAAVPGVHTRTESLLVCDLAEQPIQLLLLIGVESGANSIIVFAGDAPNLFSRVPARRREVQRVRSPVRWVLAALDQASFLEFVQEGNQLAGQDGQPASKLLLAETWGRCDQPENAGVRAEQAQAFQPFAKLTRSVRSDLRQQERGGSPKFRLCMGFSGLPGHSCILQ